VFKKGTAPPTVKIMLGKLQLSTYMCRDITV
jgi:hypothetical protein